jgi:nucleoside-diphosphate-sugar epimerase
MTSYSTEELRHHFRRIRPDQVLHLAAAGVAPGASVAELEQGNVQLTAQVIQAAAGVAGLVVNTGSCFEYRPCPVCERMHEDSPIEPPSVYGASKQTAVVLARALSVQSGVPVVTLRPFGAYGPGESPHRLIPSLVRGLLLGDGVDLTPGLQVRDLTHSDDLAEAYRLACEAPDLDRAGGVYNICSSIPTEIRTVCHVVADHLGQPRGRLRFGRLQPRPDEAPWIVGDGSRFRAATGWAPRYSLEEGVRATVDWFRSRLCCSGSFAAA